MVVGLVRRRAPVTNAEHREGLESPHELCSAIGADDVHLEIRGDDVRVDDVTQPRRDVALALEEADHLEAREIVHPRYRVPAAEEGRLMEGASEVNQEFFPTSLTWPSVTSGRRIAAPWLRTIAHTGSVFPSVALRLSLPFRV